ncbi:hypothetical protein SPTER_19370 [Sporomusa termitida]|uniref:Uncharacterized protein n=1 Tax=Sporomusa termitida TaxID=2377 RepID=A0A517DTH1_9FIRM|nr:hypothetical protein SPTER_19370 [Sporomusa termitida]
MKNTGETSGKDTQGAAKASGFVKPDKDAKKSKNK